MDLHFNAISRGIVFKGMDVALHCTAGKKRGLEDLKVVFTYYYKIIATRIDRKQTRRDW